MNVLKQGTPITLNGECGSCHTEVETDTAESIKCWISTSRGPKTLFSIKCPTCGDIISVGFQRLERRLTFS